MQKIYNIIFHLKSKYKCNIVFDSRLLKENDIFISLFKFSEKFTTPTNPHILDSFYYLNYNFI